MPVRSRIRWGNRSGPFSDPRLHQFPELVRDFRRGQLPFGWKGNKVWENRWGDLPIRVHGYYREYYVGTSEESGTLRIVLGSDGDIYISGNHHRDWLQVIDVPIFK